MEKEIRAWTPGNEGRDKMVLTRRGEIIVTVAFFTMFLLVMLVVGAIEHS